MRFGQGFEALLMRSIRVISATKYDLKDGIEASVTFELTLPSALCNPMDRMHGGAMATLADMVSFGPDNRPPRPLRTYSTFKDIMGSYAD